MKVNLRSLGVKLWVYFALFSAVIMGLIWLLQIAFLSSFYKGMKTSNVEETAQTIAEKYGKNDLGSIDQLAYRNSILVYITDLYANVLYSSDEHGPGGRPDGLPDGMMPGRFQRPLPRDYSDFLTRLSQSGTNTVTYTVKQFNFSGETLIYGMRLEETALYISTPLEPVDSTTSILQTQLIYVTLISLLLGFVIAFFIARKLSKPIAKITQAAGQLAKGDYSVQFETGDYLEIDALASTLNYTATELSKVEQLRRELIANISHDLRTPLTMIKGYTEMIEEVSGDDREKRSKHLEIIRSETERLEGLVSDILDLSVLQSGNETLNLQNVNLTETVRNVLSRFETLSEREGYRIRSRIEHDLYALADRARIEQVLYNLIGNAVNYAGEDKTITVNLIDLGGGIRFEVKDNGAGISEEELPYIWERYYKAKTHTRSKISTGIGLSIVKNVLLLHHAKFGADSTLGGGSTFWFELNK